MRTLLIKFDATSDSESTTIEALFSRCGLLAVHKRHGANYSRSDGWVVTHVGTGLGIASRATRREALAIRRALEAIRCPTVDRSPWDFTDVRPDHLSALGKLADRACESVDGGGKHEA